MIFFKLFDVDCLQVPVHVTYVNTVYFLAALLFLVVEDFGVINEEELLILNLVNELKSIDLLSLDEKFRAMKQEYESLLMVTFVDWRLVSNHHLNGFTHFNLLLLIFINYLVDSTVWLTTSHF